MYHYRSQQFADMSFSELCTRLEYCAKDMRDCSHPDQYDAAHSLAWELMNAISRHRENPGFGIDSKFRKAPYIDDEGVCLKDRINMNREAERVREYERMKKKMDELSKPKKSK